MKKFPRHNKESTLCMCYNCRHYRMTLEAKHSTDPHSVYERWFYMVRTGHDEWGENERPEDWKET